MGSINCAQIVLFVLQGLGIHLPAPLYYYESLRSGEMQLLPSKFCQSTMVSMNNCAQFVLFEL